MKQRFCQPKNWSKQQQLNNFLKNLIKAGKNNRQNG